MRYPFLDKMTELYKERDERFPKFYPRRIVTPHHDFCSPAYYSVIACSQDYNITPIEQLVIANHLAIAEMPTYFLDGNFAQAVLQTEPEINIPLKSLHLPLNEMLICLPVSIMRSYFCGFDIPFIAYTTGNAKTPEGQLVLGKKVFVFHAILVPSDGRPLGYYGRVPTEDEISRLQGYDFKDDTALANAYISWQLKGKPNPNLHDEGVKLPTKDQDLLMPDKAFTLLYKLFHILNTEHVAERYLSPTTCLRKASKPGHKHSKDELWSGAFIGKDYMPRHASNNGYHASPRLHWRRGHIRRQHFGPNNLQTKTIWIEPTLVGQ